jgi:AcrR family transcriptional regulator
MSNEHEAPDDSRTSRTRWSILQSFNLLVLQQPYARFGVSDVAYGAQVGRSTFYEHFSDKDEVLREAVSFVLAPFADAVTSAGNEASVIPMLHHLDSQRIRTLAMLSGKVRETIDAALADLIKERLVRIGSSEALIPRSLLARQIAHMQLGLLHGWLEPPARPCPAERLARALLGTTRATVRAASGVTARSLVS